MHGRIRTRAWLGTGAGPLAGTALLLLLSDRITNITGHHGLVLGTLLLAIVLGPVSYTHLTLPTTERV